VAFPWPPATTLRLFKTRMASTNVVIWGCTGFTGRLVARYFARACAERYPSLKWSLAGRNAAKVVFSSSFPSLPFLANRMFCLPLSTTCCLITGSFPTVVSSFTIVPTFLSSFTTVFRSVLRSFLISLHYLSSVFPPITSFFPSTSSFLLSFLLLPCFGPPLLPCASFLSF
jgi:hypothetical protein